MFKRPEGDWEIVPFTCTAGTDFAMDAPDRWFVESFLRQYKANYRMMLHLRGVLSSAAPVSLFSDDEVINLIAARLIAGQLVLRTSALPGGGTGGGLKGGAGRALALRTPEPAAGKAPGQTAKKGPKLVPGDVVEVDEKEYIIFIDQVRHGGSCSWRGCNPGNIRNGDSFGAIAGKKHKCGKSGMFAIFPNEAAGLAAVVQVLLRYGHVTIKAAMSKYAPKSDGNDPEVYAQKVAKKVGVKVDDYLDKLSSAQLDILATAIRDHEGWKAGNKYSRADASLPKEIRDRL